MNELIPAIMDHFGNIGIVLLAIAGGLFLLNKMRNGSKVDNAHGGFYEQLHDQIRELRDEIKGCRAEMESVYKERNVLKEQVVGLQHRVEKIEECEKMVTTMKERLAQKDMTIGDLIAENKRLMHEILQLKDRLHHLELRVTQDEAKFCHECEFKK